MSLDQKINGNLEGKEPAGAHDEVERKRFCWKSCGRGFGFVVLEIVLIGALVLALGGGVFVWRLKSGPIDLSFAQKTIEAALYEATGNVQINFTNAALSWPDFSGPLYIGLDNIDIKKEGERQSIFIEEIAISLDKSRLLFGKIEPVALIIKQPSLHVVRTQDGGFDFGFGQSAEEGQSWDVPTFQELKKILARPDKKETGKILKDLQGFEIQDALVIYEDLKGGRTLAFREFNLDIYATKAGIENNISMMLNDDEEQIAELRMSAFLGWYHDYLDLQADFKNFDPQVLSNFSDEIPLAIRQQDVVLSGDLRVRLDDDYRPGTAQMNVHSQSGYLYHEDWQEDLVPYEDFGLQASYSPLRQNDQADQLNNVHALIIEDAHISFGAAKLKGRSDFQINMHDASKLEFNTNGGIELSLAPLDRKEIQPLWPISLRDENAYDWIVKKMQGGLVRELSARAELEASYSLDEGLKSDVKALSADFTFEDLGLEYRAPLPKLHKASGSGRFDLESDAITIDVKSAKISDMDIANSRVILSDVVAVGRGSAQMDIGLRGSLSSALKYIAVEPIGVREAIQRNMKKVKGVTDLAIKLDFPTKDDMDIEEIKLDVSGTITDAYVPDVLEGLALSGGPYSLKLDNEKYTLIGNGAYADRPISLRWEEFLSSKGKPYRHKAEVSITADPNLRNHFKVDLNDFVQGSAKLDVEYTGLHADKSQIDIQADLGGSSLTLEPFGYLKKTGRGASASARVLMERGQLKEVQNLKVQAPGLSVSDGRLLFQGRGDNTKLSRAKIKRLVVGETIAGLDVEVEKSSRIKVLLNGAFLDLRPFMDDEEEKAKSDAEPPMYISVAVDQMRTSDDETVQYGKIYADLDSRGRFNQLEMDAIAGQGDIYLRYKPNVKNVRTFRFEADDAGAALKAFGLYEGVRGGKLVIYGEPVRGEYDRNLIGTAEITDFKVVDAPALARLLGALSVPGVLQLLNNEGLKFAKLEANFDWLFRPQGGLLVLKEGRTSGNSLGLTFDGVFDNAVSTIDISGTIIPLSGVNKVVSSIPLIGDILSGGSGAVFAATYSMKGQAEEPEVTVNPLSVLAPGILRRILFE